MLIQHTKHTGAPWPTIEPPVNRIFARIPLRFEKDVMVFPSVEFQVA